MQKSKLNEVLPVPTRCGECPIRRQALFQVISDDYLNEAEGRRTGQYRIAPRHLVYQEGAPAAMAYTLFDGWLLLYRTHSDGSRQGLRIALLEAAPTRNQWPGRCRARRWHCPGSPDAEHIDTGLS